MFDEMLSVTVGYIKVYLMPFDLLIKSLHVLMISKRKLISICCIERERENVVSNREILL